MVIYISIKNKNNDGTKGQQVDMAYFPYLNSHDFCQSLGYASTAL